MHGSTGGVQEADERDRLLLPPRLRPRIVDRRLRVQGETPLLFGLDRIYMIDMIYSYLDKV